MTGVITIARYEITRRWPLWVVGFGLGLLPLFFASSDSLPTHLAETLLVLGIIMSWVVAFWTGMSLVGRPLHEGRLSFFFTRPIASSAIATGKILGGTVAIVGMELVLALPLLSAPDLLDTAGVRFAGVLAFAGIAFLATGLVVGILARSRSRWFVVDALGGTLAATVTVAMFAALSKRKAEIVRMLDWAEAVALIERVDTLLRGLVIAAPAVLLGSVIVAIAIGRTDRDRVHRALSLTLWPALIVTALFGLGFAHWGIR